MDVLVTALHSLLMSDTLGQRTQYTHPNGMRTEYDYDSWNLPCSFPNWIWERDCTQNCILRPSVKSGGDLIMTAEREIEFQEQVRYEMQFRNEPLPASTEAVLDSFEYTLNDGNEITRIDSADTSNWRYWYDDRGRLETAIWWDSNNNMEDWYDYTYDDADNMTQYWRANASTQTTDTWDFVYNAANQQTSMTLNSGTAETRTYDDWGRLTARAQGSYSAAYTYRYGDRLRQVTSSFPGETATSPIYEYGGDGKLRKRDATWIKYGLGFNPVNELTTSSFTRYSYFYEPHKAVSERLGYNVIGFMTNTDRYYNHDHLGSVRRARTSTQTSAGEWNYEPYGKVHSGTATPLIFALHPYESGMGFHRAPYRNYSPNMARWTTVDPLGMVDGPNMYTYARLRPITFWDSWGASSVSRGEVLYPDGSCLIWSLGNDTEPSSDVVEGLKCISKSGGGCIRVTGGTAGSNSQHSSTSQHNSGNAADIAPGSMGLSKDEFFCRADGCGFTVGFDESDHYHIDMRTSNIPDANHPTWPNQITGCNCD